MRHFGEIDGKQVAITDHALQRMVEMKVSPEDFRLLVSDPEETFESPKYVGHQVNRRRPYSMAYTLDGECMIVVTFLWATQSDWLKANRDACIGEDRVLNLESMRNLPRF